MLPFVEPQLDLGLTKDPDGRATMGISSSGTASGEAAEVGSSVRRRPDVPADSAKRNARFDLMHARKLNSVPIGPRELNDVARSIQWPLDRMPVT